MTQYIPEFSEEERTKNGTLKLFKGAIYSEKDTNRLVGFDPSQDDLYWSFDMGLRSGNIVYVTSPVGSGLYRFISSNSRELLPPSEERNSKLVPISNGSTLKYKNGTGDRFGWKETESDSGMIWSIMDHIRIYPVADKSLLMYSKESEKILKYEI